MQSWSFPRLLTLLLALAACLYDFGYFRLRKLSPPVVRARQIASFFAGMILTWVALGSPLAHLDHQFLLAHMIQHISLMAVAVPLIYLGDPIRAFSSALLQSSLPRRMSALLHTVPLRTAARIASNPVFCWFAATFTVIGWHVPTLFNLGMHSLAWHDAEFACFFVAGLLFWWPVLRPWPSARTPATWSIPLYLFLATLPCDLLSAFLTFSGHVVYAPYRLMSQASPLSHIQDQEWAGVVMWVAVTFLYLAPAAVVTVRLLSPQSSASSAPAEENSSQGDERSGFATDKLSGALR